MARLVNEASKRQEDIILLTSFNINILMTVDNLVYSTDRTDNIPISYSKRANAPERGSVFTAQAILEKGKKDLVIDRIENYTVYIKKNLENPTDVKAKRYYRFKIVSGPHTRNYHNFFHAIPLREIKQGEGRRMNELGPCDYILIQRLGEFLLGMRFNKNKTFSKLKKSQRNWDWFHKNFR